MHSRLRRLLLSLAALAFALSVKANSAQAGDECGFCYEGCPGLESGLALCVRYCGDGERRCEIASPEACPPGEWWDMVFCDPPN
jgi:hypothetical protein